MNVIHFNSLKEGLIWIAVMLSVCVVLFIVDKKYPDLGNRWKRP